MTNEILFNAMVTRYNELAFTHNYIYGFALKGVVYMVRATSEIMPYILKLDKASRGAGYALRFCPTTEQKLLLISKGAEVLCSKAFFDNSVAESKYNKGEIFEKLVAEKYGLKWEKDNLKFTEGPDLTIEKVGYQLKFEKATFTNEKTLAGM